MTDQQQITDKKPATCHDWHELHEMPRKHKTLLLHETFYTADETNRIKLGFIPEEMEQKWFIYCDDEYIHFHRSWTGFLIYKLPIHKISDGSWSIKSAIVNNDSSQFQCPVDDENERTIFEIIDYFLLQDHKNYKSGLEQGLELAFKPNYLGSPEVISKALEPFFVALLNKLQASFETGEKAEAAKQLNIENHQLCQIFSGADKNYTPIGSWNSEKELGKEIIKYFNLDPDYYADENMYCILSEGFAGVANITKGLYEKYCNSILNGETTVRLTPSEVVPFKQTLKIIHAFVTSVLLGINSVTHPTITLKDF